MFRLLFCSLHYADPKNIKGIIQLYYWSVILTLKCVEVYIAEVYNIHNTYIRRKLKIHYKGLIVLITEVLFLCTT